MIKKTLYLLALIAFTSCGSRQLDINVMTFNLRYDNPEDSLNNWQYRKDNAAKMIELKKIDILGVQEALINQMNDLKERLPEYKAIGVGREDGKELGEFSAIFYNANRFIAEQTGYFWLSETPEVAGSKGWDGACRRIATWAVFKDKKSGKQFFAMNTHLDHKGVVARQKGISLILERISLLSKGLPTILTGDFNSNPSSSVIKHVTDQSDPQHLIDSRSIAKSISGTTWTFHDFDRLPVKERERIDYIFVNDKINVTQYETVPETFDNTFLSDHCPVLAHLQIN
ncbi:MAG: endonuclease/exonuclease/phosphatase family protein [Bacteroides sp.]|jgi:endonuclease/exonuclease/phosphatase family metal-dependent hydrolase|nr:endonuclease/exonuclease/phosphatase family protein [Bacteroides sp.]MCI1683130.1 endonuclease/exonuclease/phosphatase family protein [Bacteroides sp.]